MTNAFGNFLERLNLAGVEDADDLRRVHDAIREKLYELDDLLQLQRLQEAIQTKHVPIEYEAIFRSIKIFAIPAGYFEWSLGFEARSIQEVLKEMKLFNPNVNFCIAKFADSKVSILCDDTNPSKIQFAVKDSGGLSIDGLSSYRSANANKEVIAVSILNSFPIFGFMPSLLNILPERLVYPFLPDLHTPWDGWSFEQIRTLVEAILDGDDRYFFITQKMRILPKRKFHGKFCAPDGTHSVWYERHTNHNTDEEDEFEDELMVEWQQLNDRIESLQLDELTMLYGRLRYGLFSMTEGDVYEFCLRYLDPQNKFFRRRKKKN